MACIKARRKPNKSKTSSRCFPPNGMQEGKLTHLVFGPLLKDLRIEVSRTERHILKQMAFVCHVEDPHKFISILSKYLDTLETPSKLWQEAWNFANDSLRSTLCVRFKSEVIVCGVVYAAARRFQVPLPENPPWWKAFDAEKSGIDEVCRVLSLLYSLPKAQYIPVCKDGTCFTFSTRPSDPQVQPVTKEVPQSSPTINNYSATLKTDRPKNESKRSDDESKSMPADREAREESMLKSKSENTREGSSERDHDRERMKARDHHDRGRDSDRERERDDIERNRVRDRSHRSKDSGGHSLYHSSRDRDYRTSSYSSRDKDRHSRHRS